MNDSKDDKSRLASHAEREGMNNGAAQQNSLPAKGDEYIPLEKGASSNSADAASPNWPAATREQRSGSAADGDDSAQSGSQAVPSTGDMKAGSIPAGPAAPSAASGLAGWHDRLGACIDQVGHPDYSLREMIGALRDIRNEMFAALRSRPAQGDSKDAERYRWLRSEEVCTNPRYYDFWNRFLESKLVREESMDALIDAAMAQQEGK